MREGGKAFGKPEELHQRYNHYQRGRRKEEMERRTRAGGAWRGGATFVGCKVSTSRDKCPCPSATCIVGSVCCLRGHILTEGQRRVHFWSSPFHSLQALQRLLLRCAILADDQMSYACVRARARAVPVACVRCIDGRLSL